MVVDAVAAGPRLPRLRQAADVAPVVVGEQQGDVVGNPHTGVVIVLDLLVEGPDLRGLFRRPAGDVGDDPALVGDDGLQQPSGRALGHRLVAVAAHAHRDQALVGAQAGHALPPEAAQRLGIFRIVPGALAEAVPLDMGAAHRLVVRGPQHDAHLVGQGRAHRVVVIDRLAPHGRPQEVALQPQDQLEDPLVEGVVEAAEGLVGPAVEGRVLVVQEDAPVLDRRLLDVGAGGDEDVLARGNGDVGPPGPGRDAGPLGKVVGAEDRAALVGAGDHQGAGEARPGVFDHLLDEGLPLAVDLRNVQLARGDQGVDGRALADRADDHHRRVPGRGGAGEGGEVAAQPLDGADRAGEIGRVVLDPRGLAAGD